jgi:senataxin
VSRAPPPPRPAKAALPPPPPLPSDLVKPRDLMSAVNSGSSAEPSRPQKPKKENVTTQDNQSVLDVAVDKIDTQESQSGQKRPAMEHHLTQASLLHGEKAKPERPPAKRQKKDKGSIFIPKKHNKVRQVI